MYKERNRTNKIRETVLLFLFNHSFVLHLSQKIISISRRMRMMMMAKLYLGKMWFEFLDISLIAEGKTPRKHYLKIVIYLLFCYISTSFSFLISSKPGPVT